MPLDLNTVSIFVEVARARSFRAAGDRLGLTRSAISQAVRRLEDTFGTALLHRTTRSVSLTEAGEAFLSRVAPALAEMSVAAEEAVDRRDRPSGLLRLAVSSIAESILAGDMLTAFSRLVPDVRLDILVTDAEFDIVAHGFDAGVRLGEVIEQDMIAVPVSGPQRQMVVAAASYLDCHGTPAHPRELPAHRCIGWRPAPGLSPYRWEFAEDGPWQGFGPRVHTGAAGKDRHGPPPCHGPSWPEWNLRYFRSRNSTTSWLRGPGHSSGSQ